MKIREGQEERYQKFVSANTDFYGKEILGYGERWADLMEMRIATTGESLKKIAKRASHEADINGISGAMYGCAVSFLATCWERGDELRRWHNLDCQIGTEGESANETGGTLNPAMMVIGVKSDDSA